MKTPDKVKRLVEVFDRNLEAYKSSGYKEANVRSEFIDPFFEALGWDVYNRQGYAEAYKDVITEDAIKIGGATKAPDYCFRVGGARKFFVEAKKPSVDIKSEVSPAYQLRRYAWSAGLPLSILTDFEEFAVYDCRLRPRLKDKSGTARVIYLTYKDYPEKWEEISSIFSKQAVLEGLFDKYVESKGKRTTQEVDVEFLKEIENWRLLLARNIALRNPSLGIREINFAVQRTIDRIIFLRICEDRGIESYGKLQALLNGANIYERLRKIFQSADEKYNSGLFHFRQEKDLITPPDELTLDIKIDDRVLKEIFKQLYYPESPYEFSVLGADILGHIYEQFLGKVITLTKGHQAKVEEKPEVRKAGGVYYTPTYIVDYIVKNTVGKLCEKKTPKEIEKLRILDPACGSGSFLIGAYNYLNDYHRDWYLDNLIPQLGHEGYISRTALKKYVPGQKPEMPIYQGKGAQWYLTTREKKRILLNNIYGVDIDSQAVEVTKLSLLLKVLENENQDTLEKQMKLWRERALPDLGNNIKCGNSLIGPDFYDGEQLTLLDDEEQYRINVFDWATEFPEIMEKGGFNAVIGNPPYMNIDGTWGKGDLRLGALKVLYPKIYNDKTDLLFYFLARATQLSRNYVNFIVSRAFLEAYKADKLRQYLIDHSSISEIIDFQNYYVFPGVGITTCIVSYQISAPPGIIQVYKLQGEELSPADLMGQLKRSAIFENFNFNQSKLDSSPWSFVKESVANLNNKIDKIGQSLDEILIIGKGMETGCNDVFGKLSRQDIQKWQLNPGLFFKRATNSDIQRYAIRDRGEYVLYIEDASNINTLPKGVQIHLQAHAIKLKNRAAYKRGNCEWWKYTWPLHKKKYDRHRILCPYLAKFNRFALDDGNIFLSLTDTTVLFDNNQPENLLYLLGLLNSRLLTFRFKSIGKLKGGGIYEYFWNSISKIPIYRINFSNPVDKVRHEKMVILVEQMMGLNKQLSKVKTPDEKTRLERQIKATDNQIDQLVYELYGLTEKEIKIVEDFTR